MPAIVHLDADAFFASVEQAADPRLRGRPVAVGGEKRGIIASASYEARRFGIYTPMPTVRARKLCPRLILLPGDFEKYEQFSRWMFSYAYDFTPDVEIGSIDEGYFDLTGARQSPVDIARTIRDAIRQALKISVSEGIGTSKLVSQIASKLHKPASFFPVPAGGEIKFLHPLPNQWLPGVGPKTATRLNTAGLTLIRQVAATPTDLLSLLVGGFAPQLKNFANAIDERPVVPASAPAKSYSQQETFAQDQTDEEFLDATLRRMADRLMAQVREDGKAIRTLTVKVRFNDMDERQCSESLPEPTDLETDLYPRLRPLLRRAWERRVSLRMVSLKLANLYESFYRAELPLEARARQHEARRRLAVVVDELRRTHGVTVVRRGHDLMLRARTEGAEEKADVRRPKAEGGAASSFVLGPGSGRSAGHETRSQAAEPSSRQGPRPGPPAPARPARLRFAAKNNDPARYPDPGIASAACVLNEEYADDHRAGRPGLPAPHPPPFRPPSAAACLPLAAHSYYSFLDSTLAPKDIVALAKQQGLSAVALCDRGNLHGAVEFVQAAQAAGLQPILGAEIRVNAQPLRLYVQNATGYANLCRILSEKAEVRRQKAETGNNRPASFVREAKTAEHEDEGRGRSTALGASRPSSAFCLLPSALGDTAGLIAVSPDATLAPLFPDRFYLALASPDERQRRPAAARFPCVAVWPIHYATPADRWKYDVVQSIRTLTLLRQEHPEKRLEGEFHFRTPGELREWFRECPDALARTQEIAERCAFAFPFGQPQFPAFAPPDGSTARDYLRKLVLAGAQRRYGMKYFTHRAARKEGAGPGYNHSTASFDPIPGGKRAAQHGTLTPALSQPMGEGACRAGEGNDAFHRGDSSICAQIETELQIIHDVGYEEYFLVVWDLLQECRRRGIEWITRGSAADSLVCYCLGISDVCPVRYDLYFRRFLNPERMALHKLPDIDVDFPHDRKDDVIDLLFAKYGATHCAVVGGFSTFQARSAFAEVAKVLGVAEREVRRFTEHFPWGFPKVEGRTKKAEVAAETAEGGRRKAQIQVEREGRVGFHSAFCVPPSALGEALRSRPECRDLPLDEEPYRSALALAEFLDGFPRYPKMHPCGVVLSRQPLHTLTPTFLSGKGYPTTHFDMDAVEAIGLVKMDILAQGGLAVMRDVQTLLAERGLEVDLKNFCARKRGVTGRWDSRIVPLAPFLGRTTEGRRENPSTTDRLRPSSSAVFDSRTRTKDAHEEAAPSAWPLDDPAVWELIAGGHARAVHHIESPAMISLCRMCDVHDIDTLIAIVSVIRPGAANEDRKREFARRYQGLAPITYPHPSLEACLKASYGLLIYEEQLLQVCEAFAGLPGGRADILRRALGKEKLEVVAEIAKEFVACARARGRTDAEIERVWDLVSGFLGYTFCKAHSTAYGIEAYQSAWLKRYFPAEFMAAVLTNGKGFYRPLVYVLECWRLGLGLLPPWVNEPGPGFMVKAEAGNNRPRPSSSCSAVGGSDSRTTDEHAAAASSCFCLGPAAFSASLRVPITYVKGLTDRVQERILAERQRGEFASVRDFYRRVSPSPEEMEALIRVGACDGFGQPRPQQFWEYRQAHAASGGADPNQGWLWGKVEGRMQNAETAFVRPAGADSHSPFCNCPSALPLTEPTRHQRLEWEQELLGFPASGHPLERYDHVAWETYCPVSRLGEFVGQEVVTCGLVIEDRVHHQVTGEAMKFLTLADWTGMIETELFAQTYKSYGLATVRYPVLEIAARVEPFENGRGYTLRVLRAGPPRERKRP